MRTNRNPILPVLGFFLALLLATSVQATVSTAPISAGSYGCADTGSSSGAVALTPGAKCASGTLTIKSAAPITQATPSTTQGSLTPKAHNLVVDRQPMTMQQIDRRVAAAEATHAVDKAAKATSDSSTVITTRTRAARMLKDRFAATCKVKDNSAKGDNSTDDTAAIQSTATNCPLGGTVEFEDGIYRVSSTLNLPAGRRYVASSRFAGNQPGPRPIAGGAVIRWVGAPAGTIVRLAGTSAGYHNNSHFKGLRFDTDVAGVTAFSDGGTTIVGNVVFEGMEINTPFGFSFTKYAQFVVWRDLMFNKNTDQMFNVRGNILVLRDIDKEGSSGSSTDPYVKIVAHKAGRSTSITLDNLLLEQGSSVSKHWLDIDGASNVKIANVWEELGQTDGLWASIANSENVSFSGFINGVNGGTTGGQAKKLKFRNTSNVVIDFLHLASVDEPMQAAFDVDSASTITVRHLRLRRSGQSNPLTKFAVDVNTLRDNQGGVPNAAVEEFSRRNTIMAQNWFVNPSFEFGTWGWAIGKSRPSLTASAVGLGSMLQWSIQTGTNQVCQTVTIPAEMVGQPITLQYRVKASAGVLVSPYISGAGIDISSPGGFERVTGNGTDWYASQITFRPQAAGAMRVGVTGYTASGPRTVWLDDLSLAPGKETAGNPAKFGSIDFANGRGILTGTGSPLNVVTAPVGTMYLRSDGGAGTTLYVKESAAGSTGWVAK